MIKLLILLVLFIFIITLLIFTIKKVAKFAIFVGIVLLALIVVGSIANIDFRGAIKDKAAEVVGMVIGDVGEKAVDYTKENLNITKAKEIITGEVKD